MTLVTNRRAIGVPLRARAWPAQSGSWSPGGGRRGPLPLLVVVELHLRGQMGAVGQHEAFDLDQDAGGQRRAGSVLVLGIAVGRYHEPIHTERRVGAGPPEIGNAPSTLELPARRRPDLP